MIQVDYSFIRHSLKNGDVIAFGGTSITSTIIRSVTSSNISHVGIIIKTYPGFGSPIIQIIESTSLEKSFPGVAIQRLSTRISSYNGSVWILPLDDNIRKQMNIKKYLSFVLAQEGKPYDYRQALHSAVDSIFPDTKADFSRLFCSELVVAGLQAGGIPLLSHINPSEQTPVDVVRLPIYGDPMQVKGSKMEFY